MNENLIKLFSRVEVAKTGQDGNVADTGTIHALNATIAALGYTLDRDVLADLKSGTQADLDLFLSDIVSALTSITGANRDFQVLFAGFPYDTPNGWDYLVSRIVGYVQNQHGASSKFTLLSCGHLIDPDLFDVTKFGACPICQVQVPELRAAEKLLIDYQPLSTPLKLLSLATASFQTEAANGLLARPTSLSLDERSFLLSRLFQNDPPLTVPDRIFRETLPYAWASIAMRDGNVALGALRTDALKLLHSPTDVLRIATFLSNPEADLSLNEDTRFRLSTSKAKAVLRSLDKFEQAEIDMVQRPERWKRLAGVLKPGTAENRMLYPNVASAYDALMRNAKEIDTFNRQAEKLLAGRHMPAYTALLSDRPGEMMRKLDLILRQHPGNGSWDDVLLPMRKALPKVPTPLLFTVFKYLGHRLVAAGDARVFRPKGPSAKIMVVDDARPSVPYDGLVSAMAEIQQEQIRRFSGLAPMGRVFIDPELSRIVLPLHGKRASSSTSVALTRGMNWKVEDDCDVLRLFVWWKGAGVDVDLSINLMDEQFQDRGHVGFTRPNDGGCQHSGDIQRAPDGAAEFIDIPIAHVAGMRMRYACMSVLSWTGQPFSEFPCFAGFMQRDAVKSGQRFEPEAVTVKIDLNAKATGNVPVVFDLLERRIIYTDLTAGSRGHASALGHNLKFRTLAKASVEAPLRMPTVGDLIDAHVRARGTRVDTPEKADLAWTADALDWDAVYALLE